MDGLQAFTDTNKFFNLETFNEKSYRGEEKNHYSCPTIEDIIYLSEWSNGMDTNVNWQWQYYSV
jgi:hypothetical protein